MECVVFCSPREAEAEVARKVSGPGLECGRRGVSRGAAGLWPLSRLSPSHFWGALLSLGLACTLSRPYCVLSKLG